jgi:hypothetical protein
MADSVASTKTTPVELHKPLQHVKSRGSLDADIIIKNAPDRHERPRPASPSPARTGGVGGTGTPGEDGASDRAHGTARE